MPRILVSVQRRIRSGQLPHYELAWPEFRRAALGRGAKAWRFRSPADEALYLEFLEFAAEADPRLDAELKEAMDQLEGIAAGRVEEWVDANIQ